MGRGKDGRDATELYCAGFTIALPNRSLDRITRIGFG